MAGEISQKVINETVVKANTPARKFRIRIKGFDGTYNGIWFDDQGQSSTKVTEAFVEQFKTDFPDSKWQIEEIADDTPMAKRVIPGTALA